MLRTILVLPRLPIPFFSRSVSSNMSSTQSPLKLPRFVSVEESGISSISKPDGIRFSLVSYNILAQAYVKSSLFPHSPSSSLKWKARSQAILNFLKNLGADFLCLQEVDEYESFYKGNMESSGYSSTYIQRSGQKRDGCGIFYKHDMAELVLEDIIDYNDLVNSIQDLGDNRQNDKEAIANKDPEPKNDMISSGGIKHFEIYWYLYLINTEENGGLMLLQYLINNLVYAVFDVLSQMFRVLDVPMIFVQNQKLNTQDLGDPNDPRVRLKRDCVGLMAAFKLKDTSQNVVIVANTHIYWDPDWADVKLAQAKYLLSRLAQFKTLVSDRFECTPSLIVAGDFNSTPGDKVYQYLILGNASSAPTLDALEDLPIPLCSVYASTRGEPPFTNYTPGFTGTLDYIFFFPTDHIKPVSFLELPEPESSDIDGGLPNFSHPSDH